MFDTSFEDLLLIDLIEFVIIVIKSVRMKEDNSKMFDTIVCQICGNTHKISEVEYVYNKKNYLQQIPICQNCFKTKAFKCWECGKKYIIGEFSCNMIDNRMVCDDCFKTTITTCGYCGKTLNSNDGVVVYSNSEDIFACTECAKKYAFVCDQCDEFKQKSEMAISKYISDGNKICNDCIQHCENCNIEIDYNNTKYSFDKAYCPECWENKTIECRYCGEKYIPNVDSQKECPDCSEMLAYVNRLKKADFKNRAYKNIEYYSLDHINRCTTFTDLVDHCNKLEGKRVFRKPKSEIFHFIIMSFFGYNIVITKLPLWVIGNVKCSKDVTMTGFRSQKGRLGVLDALDKWLGKPNRYINTSAGRMKILNYPIRLRVQTNYDKTYGKHWNGPDDYIEIGNYGDATDFYIIGVIQ